MIINDEIITYDEINGCFFGSSSFSRNGYNITTDPVGNKIYEHKFDVPSALIPYIDLYARTFIQKNYTQEGPQGIIGIVGPQGPQGIVGPQDTAGPQRIVGTQMGQIKM